MSSRTDEITVSAAAQALGLSGRQIRRLADADPALALGRDALGHHRISASRVAAIAIARAARKAVGEPVTAPDLGARSRTSSATHARKRRVEP